MECPRCQQENRAGRKFCSECGASLALACPSCGFSNEPGEKFCGGCATPLTLPESASLSTLSEKVPSAERRQLTVMFCDLVGSTALSEHLDPEELHEVVRAYHEVSTEVIGRFEGHVAQYLGDGLLVYFGYPAAHEDDAPRAVYAALGIVEAVGKVNARLRRSAVKLAVRVGVHTGPVVVGEVGGRAKPEQLALGETPNLAARLQGLAEPDTVVISAATHRLVRGLFACRDLGLRTLKGASMPLQVYRVLGENRAGSLLEGAVTTGLTLFVGREQEVALLLERWGRAKDGFGQVVLLSGEAGIGKSRLARLLKERLASEPYGRLECRCSAYHQNSVFFPVVELLRRAFELNRQDPEEEKLAKLEAGLAPFILDLSQAVPLCAALLSIPLPDRYPPLSLSPQRQKEKTLEVLLRGLLTRTEREPVLLIVEDLHWVDPSTLELLSLIVDHTPTVPMLTLLTFRSDFRPPWPLRAHVTPLSLNRFTRTQTELMILRLTGGKALPADVLEQVVAKTDGIPLFVEELTKMVLESGWLGDQGDSYALRGPLPPLAIPATLQDSLMARLDRLATVKEVAQLGATLGREFSFELLRAVSSLEEAKLQAGLAQLVEAELLYQRGFPPQSTYVFKHALVQEAAYQSLLKRKRQQYHQQIAAAIEARFPETRETQPELLAHHYTEADLKEQAIVFWQRAGLRTVQHSANVEAINHLTKGLELLRTLPDTPERAQQELLLQTTLGPALMATKGYAAPEVEKAYARARELCQQAGEAPELFRVLAGLWAFYFTRGELQTAREVAGQLLTLAERGPNPAFLLEAYHALGQTLCLLGEWASARAHLEEGIALQDPPKRRLLTFPDTRMVCLSNVARALWFLGYPEQALKNNHQALALATELSHPLSIAIALFYGAWLHQLRREAQATRAIAERAVTLSTEQGFPFWAAAGTILRGWALAEEAGSSEGRGQGQAAIAEIRRGITAWRAIGAVAVGPYYLGLLAEAYRGMGQPEAGLAALAEALEIANKNGERFYDAELYRLKGEFALQPGGQPPPSQAQSPASESEGYFRQAIDIARRQGARSLELRAATSLARLLAHRGAHEEARRLLADIYGWFTEGFDTADLKTAKTLLNELS